MFGHLRASDFVDLLEGLEIPRSRAHHLANCPTCSTTLAAMSDVHDDLTSAQEDPLSYEITEVDWEGLRSSVRNELLSRSVERSSRLRRWTGTAMKPAAAWGLGLALVVSVVTAGAFWHYRTEHGAAPSTEAMTAFSAQVASTESELRVEDFEADLIENEVVVWAQTDLFSVLGQLELSEEEMLRELITQAVDDPSPFLDGALQ